MLEPRDAFYLALEWMQLPPQANDKKLRMKVAQGMLSTADASDASEQHALKHGLKAVRFSEEMQGFVLPSINSWSEVLCDQGVKESIVATWGRQGETACCLSADAILAISLMREEI